MTTLVLALLSFACVCAVGADESASHDATAATLRHINTRASQISSYSARFRQITTDPTYDETDVAAGRIFFLRHKPHDDQQAPTYSVRFDYLQPERSVTIMNPTKVILWQRGAMPQEHAVVDNLAVRALLAGLTSFDELNEHFIVTIASQTVAYVVVTLTPNSEVARRTFRSLSVTFDAHTWLPTAVQQDKRDGTRVVLQFTQPVINRTISPEIFTLAYLQRQLGAAAASTPARATATNPAAKH